MPPTAKASGRTHLLLRVADVCPRCFVVAGTSCAVGSAEPKACLPGLYNPHEGRESCELCSPGKFTATARSTSCQDCKFGYLCIEGSSAPQPCNGGTHANQTVLQLVGYLSSLDECIACPSGTSCAVGSAMPKPCLPGSVAAEPQQEACVQCRAGKYQSEPGQTSCFNCSAGSYCPSGASASLARDRRIEPETFRRIEPKTFASRCLCSLPWHLACSAKL